MSIEHTPVPGDGLPGTVALEEAGTIGAVASIGLSPAYRQGLTGALAQAGLQNETPTDIGRWAAEPGSRAIVTPGGDERHYGRLVALRKRNPQLAIVVLLRHASPQEHGFALRNTIDAAVALDAQLDEIVDVVRAALKARSLMPIRVAHALAKGQGRRPDDVTVGPQEARWLRRLATGATVGQVARDAGYSERETYRLLNQLYERMGVSNRSEALVRATQWGLMDDQLTTG